MLVLFSESMEQILEQKLLEMTSNSDYKFLLVLDFEATCWQRSSGAQRRQMEIIELPVLVLECSSGNIVREFHEYVRPTLNAKLSDFCTQLTGIEQATVDAADPFDKVFGRLLEFLAQNEPTLIDEGTGQLSADAVWLTCGDWDLKTMLPQQLKLSSIDRGQHLFARWINIKRAFSRCVGTRARGMDDMLKKLDLKLLGRHHNGYDDCVNISRVCTTLLDRGHRFNSTEYATFR
jgi:ERI1 exoribonuclease 3